MYQLYNRYVKDLAIVFIIFVLMTIDVYTSVDKYLVNILASKL